MDAQRQELKDRVEAKQKRLEARIHELKADTNEASREKAQQLQSELDDVKERISQGYENLKDSTMDKLNDWLKD